MAQDRATVDPCRECDIAPPDSSLGAGTRAARAALLEPLGLIDPGFRPGLEQADDDPPRICVESALGAGVWSAAWAIYDEAWLDSWFRTERRSVSDYLFTGSTAFVLAAGHTAVRCRIRSLAR